MFLRVALETHSRNHLFLYYHKSHGLRKCGGLLNTLKLTLQNGSVGDRNLMLAECATLLIFEIPVCIIKTFPIN